MAIISYVGSELNPANSTFQDWLTRTNEIIGDMGDVVVTIGGENVGNFTLQGEFQANSIVSDTATIDTLTVLSEMSVPSLVVSSNASIEELNVSMFADVAELEVTGNTVLNTATIEDLFVTSNTALANTSIGVLTVTGNTALANTSVTNLTVSANTSVTNLSSSANTSLTNVTVTGNTTLADTSVTNLTASESIQANEFVATGNSFFESILVNNFEVTGVFNIDTIGITANTVFQNIEVTGNTSFTTVWVDFMYIDAMEAGTIDVQGDAFFTRIESANNILTSITANTINTANFSASANTSLTRLVVTANTSLANTAVSGTFSVSGNTSLQGTTASSLSISGTGALKLPVGATAQRPSGIAGHIRFNETLTQFEGFDGTQWGKIGGSADVADDTSTNETRYITFVSNTTGEAETLGVSSTKLFFNPSTGSLNATEFNSLSDIAYKEDFQSISNATDILSRINTYSFRWKETGQKSYGVLAQELEEVLPELINNSNGTKYVNYTPLIAVLLEGYKKLAEKVAMLEKGKSD